MKNPLTDPLLSLSDEVEDAIAERRPIVALESTLLAHGLPEAKRETVAEALESIVRAEGGVPATIAVIDHQLCVGLDTTQRARIIDGSATKASICDLPVALARGGAYATTVASTMDIARRAGIRVFATGGIGGVHRGASSTFDESADLTALQHLPVGVVSAGAKAILDLPKTLERLETLGVTVVGFRTSEFPAFYHGASGLAVAHRIDDPLEIAKVLRLRIERLEGGGMLIVQPPPAEDALDPATVDAWIAQALLEAEEQALTGPAMTPFLLARLDALSGGHVVETNVALVKANAALATRIAVSEMRLDNDG